MWPISVDESDWKLFFGIYHILGLLFFLGFFFIATAHVSGQVVGNQIIDRLYPNINVEEIPYYPPRENPTLERRSDGRDQSFEPSICSICLSPFKPSILVIPCFHMCICDGCYNTVRNTNLKNCPVCRGTIYEVQFTYPS